VLCADIGELQLCPFFTQETNKKEKKEKVLTIYPAQRYILHPGRNKSNAHDTIGSLFAGFSFFFLAEMDGTIISLEGCWVLNNSAAKATKIVQPTIKKGSIRAGLCCCKTSSLETNEAAVKMNMFR
jgi:hypothetical protein